MTQLGMRGDVLAPCGYTPMTRKNLKLSDGEEVFIETEAGSAKVEAEVTDSSHRGQIVIPHGFGLVHLGEVSGSQCKPACPGKTQRPSGSHSIPSLYPLSGPKGFVCRNGRRLISASERGEILC